MVRLQADLARLKSVQDEGKDRVAKFRSEMDQQRKMNAELKLKATRSEQQLHKVLCSGLS